MTWKVNKQTGSCAACQRPFADAEPHYSLIQIQGEEIGREDRCLECWKKAQLPAESIYWRTTHYIAPNKKRKIDFDALREIFLQLCDKREPGREPLHYLVALLLVRKKILKIRQMRRDGDQDLLVLGFPRAKETFEISVPDLAPDRLESLKQELAALFGEPEEPATTSASPFSPPASPSPVN